MFRVQPVSRQTAAIAFFLADCLLIGALAGSGSLSLVRAVGCGLGFVASVAALAATLTWARTPAASGRTGVTRISELGVRSDIAQKRAIRVEDTELYRRWYLEYRIKQEGDRCQVYGSSMAVVVVRLGSTELANWAGNFWTEQVSVATPVLLKFVRSIDICAPIGPLEFAIMLVQCNRQAAEGVAAQISERFRAQDCETGAAAFPEDRCEPAALVELARGRVRRRGTWVAAA
jgi:GGDEF domain-containing protein